ncbi:MAG: hypothetical protein V1779_02975 [bacterium]
MDAIKISSTKNNVNISIDRNVVSEDDILMLMSRLKIESLINRGDINKEVVNLSKEINANVWEQVKKDINFIEPVNDNSN